MADTEKYRPLDHVPLPPKSAKEQTTACAYCVVGCGYKVYTWPVGTGRGTTSCGERPGTVGAWCRAWSVGESQSTQCRADRRSGSSCGRRSGLRRDRRESRRQSLDSWRRAGPEALQRRLAHKGSIAQAAHSHRRQAATSRLGCRPLRDGRRRPARARQTRRSRLGHEDVLLRVFCCNTYAITKLAFPTDQDPGLRSA